MPRIAREINVLFRCGAQYRTEALAPMGLKACHASYLLEISAHPGISQDQLAQRILINKSNVARQVAVLEEEGYIRREPSPQDRRVMELYPTQKALVMKPLDSQRKEEANWEYAMTVPEIADKIENKSSIKNSQALKPLFEFSGACAGWSSYNKDLRKAEKEKKDKE